MNAIYKNGSEPLLKERNSEVNKRRLYNTLDTGIVERFLKCYFPDADQHLTACMKQLHENGIIEDKRLRNYMIIKEYYSALRTHNGHASKAVAHVSDLFDMSSRQIQNIVYKWSEKFKKREF